MSNQLFPLFKAKFSDYPSACGGFATDINLVDHYGDVPTYDSESYVSPKTAKALEVGRTPGVAEVCLTNAIKVYGKQDGGWISLERSVSLVVDVAMSVIR